MKTRAPLAAIILGASLLLAWAQEPQGFSNRSLQGTYALSFTLGANVGTGLGTCVFGGQGNYTCDWIINMPFNEEGPALEGERLRVPVTTAATYTVNADGRGHSVFATTFPDGFVFEGELDLLIKEARPMGSVNIATRLFIVQQIPGVPAEPARSLVTVDLTRISDEMSLSNQVASPRSHEAIARQLVDAWVKADLEVLDDLMADTFTNHSPDVAATNKEESLALAPLAQQAFPGWTGTVEQVLVDGELVNVLVRWQGTHSGDQLGIPASGKDFDFSSMITYRIEDGKITDRLGVTDWFTFYQQIGMQLVPASAEPTGMTEPESDASSQQHRLVFSANLSGDQVVPAVSTTASGTVNAVLVDDLLVVTGNYQNLSSDVMVSASNGVHLHRGATGENGSIERVAKEQGQVGKILNFSLANDGGTSGSFNAVYNVTEEQIESLKNGLFYLQIHSQNHQAGELRGQLMPTSELVLAPADLVGEWSWESGNAFVLFKDDGSFTIDSAQQGLATSPADHGEFELNGNVLSFIRPEASSACTAETRDQYLIEVSSQGRLQLLELSTECQSLSSGWQTFRRITN